MSPSSSSIMLILGKQGLLSSFVMRSLSTSTTRPAINHEFHKVIKWNPPEDKDPWAPQKTCDLRPIPKVDPNWLKVEYRPFADLIEKLPENHRKIFTVNFGPRKDGIAVIMKDTLDKVKRNKYDETSLDVKIAWATVRIRDYQNMFVHHPQMRKAGYLRNNVKELIEKRKKWLRWMRCSDYKRFEWIIEVMGILYKPCPPNTRIERKASLNVLVNMFCNEIREQKMEEYKKMLESEKVPFLETKLSTLERIKEDEESVNLPCSVLEDIEETKKMLESLTKSHMTVYPVGQQNLPSENQQTISS